jgi:cephalosporin hydroxylase
VKIEIDTEQRSLSIIQNSDRRELSLFSPESFDVISDLWLKVGWNEKYTYTFTWLGRPIIQLPEDIIRAQEAVWQVKPDVIIETGVAHGGSLIFYASLLTLIGRGRVVGIDHGIRPPNRAAIETHPLSDRIDLVEGNSTDAAVLASVRDLVPFGARAMVFLDSNHSYEHVKAELSAYANFVSVGSFIVATDGIMRDLADVPRGQPSWAENNPQRAAADFAVANPEFVVDHPAPLFSESDILRSPTHWPGAWLRRVR